MESAAILALRRELVQIGEGHRALNERAIEIVSEVLRERERSEAAVALKAVMTPARDAARVLRVSKKTIIRWAQDDGVARQHGTMWHVPRAWVRERADRVAK